jgi:hypothetical protein
MRSITSSPHSSSIGRSLSGAMTNKQPPAGQDWWLPTRGWVTHRNGGPRGPPSVVGWTLSANSKEDNSRLRGIKSGIASFQEVGAVKKTRVLIPALTALLLFSGCAAKVTTTTSSPPTTNAPTTTTAGSTSTTTTALSTVATTFTAQLSGTEVVPAVDTSATGSATFTVDATGTRVHFVLKVSNITDVIASRVHEGKPGTNSFSFPVPPTAATSPECWPKATSTPRS